MGRAYLRHLADHATTYAGQPDQETRLWARATLARPWRRAAALASAVVPLALALAALA